MANEVQRIIPTIKGDAVESVEWTAVIVTEPGGVEFTRADFEGALKRVSRPVKREQASS